MNNHTVSYELLIDFAAGDLSEIETAATAEHVAQCPECSVTVQRFRQLSELRFADVLADPPLATVERAQALFARYYPAPQRRPWFNWNWAPGPAFAAAAVLVICMLSIVLVAVRDASPDTALYSVKMAVEGLELRVSDVLHQFAETPKPKPTPTPTPTATPSSAGTDLLGPDRPATIPPGQEHIPPGQVNTPPGQAKTPPGQGNPPSGQAKTPPGQVNTPPGQVQTPPGQAKTPPGQAKTPSGQGSPPSGQNQPAPTSGTPTATVTPTPTLTPTPIGTLPSPGNHKDTSGNTSGNTPGKK